jgi:hypothetical protein
MSEAIVVSGSGSKAMQLGGMGLGSTLFRARPAMIEMVQKTTRQAEAIPGQFRNISTNEHFGSTMRVVMLAPPQEQREWFEGPDFSKDSKKCFSIDNVQPHPRAAAPPAMFCKTCPKGDINWEKWRKTKQAADLPPCQVYWHLLLADRTTQQPFYLNVKGISYLPFKRAMETQMAGLLAKLIANVKAENKQRGYTLVTLRNAEGSQWQEFQTTPGYVLPQGKTEQDPPLPMPNVFDISFDIVIESKNGQPYSMNFVKFALMSPEDKAEFGQLYLDIIAQRNEQAEQAQAAEEQAQVDSAVSEPVAGEVVVESKITI